MTSKVTALEEAKNYSNEKIKAIRDELAGAIRNDSISIVTVGSFARREASQQSDLDFFFITDNDVDAPNKEIEIFRKLIVKRGIKMPAESGAFNETQRRSEMIRNIGGNEDITEKLTRRLLFLLEGEWLYNKKLFDKLFDQFINLYVKDTITDHQLCRFLLNDLIRYYRTICVDFAFKTSEDGKSWGDRNIKLIFSRKLLYFSGILVVAETVQHNPQTKREILKKYLRLTPLERVKEICGLRSEKVLRVYDDFLAQMASPEVRAVLKETKEDPKKHSPEFQTFKNKGHHFTFELSRLLDDTYDASHPIHNAIKF